MMEKVVWIYFIYSNQNQTITKIIKVLPTSLFSPSVKFQTIWHWVLNYFGKNAWLNTTFYQILATRENCLVEESPKIFKVTRALARWPFFPMVVHNCLKVVRLIPKAVNSEEWNSFIVLFLVLSWQLNVKLQVFLGFIFKYISLSISQFMCNLLWIHMFFCTLVTLLIYLWGLQSVWLLLWGYLSYIDFLKIML